MPLQRREASALDVFDRVLDKGIIIDYWARMSVFGIDLLTITEGRVVVASMDTYLRYTEPIRKSGLRAQDTAPALTPGSLKGALDRALTPLPPRVPSPQLKPGYDGPAPYFAKSNLPVAKARDSILNPFSVYQKGERVLRGQLKALSTWHLVSIAEAYALVNKGVDPTLLSQPELVELIVSAIKRRKGQPVHSTRRRPPRRQGSPREN